MLCIRCGANNPKGPCGRKDCPYLLLYTSARKVRVEGKEEFSGRSPNVFVGRHGYPNIQAGFLAGEFVDDSHDSPKDWIAKGYNISSIVELRSSLINSRYRTNVKSFDGKYAEMALEIAMAKDAVEVEVKLEKKPHFTLSLSEDVAPFGPSVALRHAEITKNPRIPSFVERLVEATDVKASDAVSSLTDRDVDEHSLTKLLSVGALGVKAERRLVPTRWSITAVDDMLGKRLIMQVKGYPVADYQVFFGGYLGNYYLVLFFPDVWSYELFETHVQSSHPPMTDYEGYQGRKDYAANTVGGYYAARVGILERLAQMRRQSSVLALRFITSEYSVPLGVWVVRTATRKAMEGHVRQFSSKEEMLRYARSFIKERFMFDADRLLGKSILIRELGSQRKLSSYGEV